MRIPSGLRIDSPAWPLLLALISYWGTTDNDGNVGGTTIRCGGLATEPPYDNHALKILTGPSAGQTRDLTAHPAGTDTLTVIAAFTNVTGAAQQILAGTKFVILSKTPAIAEVAALQAICIAILTLVDVLGLTTFDQETAVGVAANGVTDVTLFDGTGITLPTQICGFRCTMAGAAWAGHPVVWIEDGDGNKIFPFQDNYVEGTDFADGAQVVFNFPVVVPVASGYLVRFRSTAAGDNAGQTLTLDNLDIIEVG